MVLQELNEALSHGAGCAEDAYGDLHRPGTSKGAFATRQSTKAVRWRTTVLAIGRTGFLERIRSDRWPD
jgi:hypothetical protein